jgi:hypothetical protein
MNAWTRPTSTDVVRYNFAGFRARSDSTQQLVILEMLEVKSGSDAPLLDETFEIAINDLHRRPY